jgi:glutamyl-tRNA synthetase
LQIYAAALRWLYGKGLIYPCLCSRKDVLEAASAPHGGGLPLYPGTCRQLSYEDLLTRQKEKGGKSFSWRLHIEAPVEIHLNDQLQGVQIQDIHREVGDFILRRADGLFAYQLAVVIDDLLMGVSDVVRAMDLLDSAPRQAYLFHLLGRTPPSFCHVPLLMDPLTGKRLSKRDGSDSLRSFREKGQSAAAVIGSIAHRLGFLESMQPCSAHELLSGLDLSTFIQTLNRVEQLDYQPE